MLETIIEAASNFCNEQLGIEDLNVEKTLNPPQGTLVAYIDIEMQEQGAYRIYLAAERSFVQFVAQIFLEESQSDEDTMRDMALECTNMIVGSAKVIASEKGIGFRISTPKLEIMQQFTPSYHEAASLQCGDSTLFIAIEERNDLK